MKLSILLAGSILTSAIAGNVYAQTCGAQPSCAELGYTLTSTADCIGIPLKCPFDKTKYNCTQKSKIFSNMKLAWNRKVSFNRNSNYRVLQYGFIFIFLKDRGNGSVSVSVNGIKFMGSNHSGGVQFYAIPVSPDDVVYATAYDDSYDQSYFVPFAGN